MAAAIGVWLQTGCAATERGSLNEPAGRQCEALRPGEAHQTLLNRAIIESVEPLAERPVVFRPSPLKKAAAEQRARTIGVSIRMRPAVGLTAERLQLLATCDSLNVDLTAHDAGCPFGVKGTSVAARSTGAGFAVEIEATDAATVEELLRRSRALVAVNAPRSDAAPVQAP